MENKIEVGTKVIKDGYEGIVVEICSWNTNMVIVKLNSGTACVSKSNFSGKYENNYIIK
jgi:hypothetical protein